MLSAYAGSQKFPTYCWRILRSISTSPIIHCNKPSLTVSLQDFKPIYKFRLVQHLGLINRLKIYQSACTAFVIPTTLLLNIVDVLDIETCILASAFGLSGTVALFAAGLLTNKLVGFIYINRTLDTIRIAYVDFWGKRQDINIPKTDIVPICGELLTKTERVYYRLKRYSVAETYALNLSHCEVLDEKLFRHVFGISNK